MANDPLAFLHDANARNDEKVLELRARGGWEAYGLFFALVEMLREASGLKLPMARIPALALSLSVNPDTLRTVITDCVMVGLFVEEEGFFSAPSLTRRVNRYRDKCEALRNNGSKGGKRTQEIRRDNQANGSPNALANASKDESKCLNAGKQMLEPCSSNPNITKSNRIELGTSLGEEVPMGLVDPPPADPKYFDLENPDFATGRFRLKKYPFVWMHQWELEQVNELFLKELSLDDLRDAMLAANSQLERKQDHRDFKTGLALSYLVGHIHNAALQKRTDANRLVRSRGETPPAKPESKRTQKFPPAAKSAPMTSLGEVLEGFGMRSDDEVKS